MTIIHNVQQGSEAWHALRATTRNASEAPAMMGVSSYKTRTALVAEKATGIIPEIDDATQRRFDEGHRTEAKARSILEEQLGEDLYPLVATDDEGYLLASSDGSDMCRSFGFEHKLWNAEIAAKVAAGEVPDSHKWQLDQQIEVFGFEKIIFVCSDGTADNFVSCEYRTTPERIAQLRAGWKQFDEDVAAYVPEVVEAKPILTASPIDNLPALIIEVTGRVTHSNLAEFKACAVAVIGSIKTDLVSDQDFVDATNAVKYLKDVEDNAKRAKQNALDQTTSIADLHRALDEVAKMAGDVRKALDKKITEEKDKRKSEIIFAGKVAFDQHAGALNKRIGGFMPTINVDFAGEVKGLRSLDSMKDKISSTLANAKIDANAIADRIESNIKSLESDGENFRFLFPDLMSVCAKASDDFAALLASRKATHREAEEKRRAAEVERIRAEEQAKAQHEAQAKADAAARELAEQLAAEERKRIEEHKAQAEANAKEVKDKLDSMTVYQKADHIEQPLTMVETVEISANTLKLGEICARLGYTVTAEFLASLGFEPVSIEKNARHYRESSWPAICRRIADHTLALAFKKAA